MFFLKFTCIASFVILLVDARVSPKGKKEQETSQHRQKRDGGLSAALIGAAISAGSSLVGTTVNGLKQSAYSVAVSGSVTNFAADPLILEFCKLERGHMNEPLRDIASGQREGFAGHKTSNTATGNEVLCKYRAGTGAIIYLMYSAPYSFDFYKNFLSVSICHPTSSSCQVTDVNFMTSGKRSDLKRVYYQQRIETLKLCNMGFCVTGVMGTSHKPEIAWKVYPVKFEDLATAVQGSAAKDRWDRTDYDRYVNTVLS